MTQTPEQNDIIVKVIKTPKTCRVIFHYPDCQHTFPDKTIRLYTTFARQNPNFPVLPEDHKAGSSYIDLKPNGSLPDNMLFRNGSSISYMIFRRQNVSVTNIYE